MARRSLGLGGVFVGWLMLSAGSFAQGTNRHQLTPEQFEAGLKYQGGTITLRLGLATIQVPPSFRYLGPDDSRRVVGEGWGNPPDAVEGLLGMLVPQGLSPLSPAGWGILITYEEDGYVSDADAASINYDELLTQMQHAAAAQDEQREREGFARVRIVGWAEPPSYDSSAHKLYWAKELAFGKDGEHRTLNYSIRVLGRRGVLELNAVAAMSQLQSIRAESQSVLVAVNFNDGHRYSDYVPGTDKAAAYGLAGLIVGAAAAKAGLFKLLWVGILAFKKLIVLGVIALWAAIKRMLGGRPKERVAS